MQSYKLHRTPRLSGSFHSLDVPRRLRQQKTGGASTCFRCRGFLLLDALLGRDDRRVSQDEGKENEDAADDVRHDGELDLGGIGRAVKLGHEGNVLHAVLVMEMPDEARHDNRDAVDADETGEEEGIEFLDDVATFRPRESEESEKTKKAGDEGDKREDAGFGENVFGVSEGSEVPEVREAKNPEGQGNGKVGSDEGQGDGMHDLVRVLSFAIHVEEGDVRRDEGDDREDDEDRDDEAEIVVTEVRGSEAIEPGGVEQEEEGDDVPEGDVARERLADQIVIAATEESHEAVGEADEGDEHPGKAKGAEHDAQADADFGDFDVHHAVLHREEVRGDQESKPNAEEAESGGQDGIDDDVDEAGGW